MVNAMSTTWSRRQFLKRSLGGAAALGIPLIVPSGVLAGDNRPSNRIAMACIGVGGQGTGNMRAFLSQDDVRVVAVCDVDSVHLEQARKTVNGAYGDQGCEAFSDFRDLLQRSDLDAVSLAAPDHWHALLAVSALRAGKDVYGEKPLARSIHEGRAICNAVERYGRVWQTGSQQRSSQGFRRACELIRNGRLGKLNKIVVGLPTGPKPSPKVGPISPPPYLDWDFWLGPAPVRPFMAYGKNAPHWDWRWIMDFSGGQLTDWCGHHVDIAQWALGVETSGPVAVEGVGEYYSEGVYDTPYTYDITATYANGQSILITSRAPNGIRFTGEKGELFVSRAELTATPDSILREVIGPEEIHLYESRNHHRNFIECMRTRAQTVAPAEIAHRSISTGLLGEIAMITGRKIKWNPAREEIIGDPAASALLGRAYREPWTL